MRCTWVFVLGGLFASTAASAAEQPSVESFHCSSRPSRSLENVSNVNEAYQRQSVEIVKAGLRKDVGRLRTAVATGAKLAIRYGDVLMNSDIDGPDGVTLFVERLRPMAFEFTTHFFGPISMSPCGQIEVDVVFQGPGTEGTKVTFKYNRGLLEEAVGYRGTYERGDFEAPR